MANEVRLIDANAFIILLAQRDFDFFAKTQIKEWRKTSTADVGYSIATISDVFDMTPTVDAVEVVHGRWIWTVTGEEDYEQYYRCSKCNDHMYSEYNYCPNCGAKMDGDGNGDTML